MSTPTLDNSSSTSNEKEEHTPPLDTDEKKSLKNTAKATSKKSLDTSSDVFTGLFWIIAGAAVLLYNFIPDASSFKTDFQTWGVLVLAIYLIVFSLLRRMRKFYFMLGILLLALWLGQLIVGVTAGTTSNIQKMVWPVIMLVISVSVIVYALLFKRESKKFMSYVVVGSVLVIFSILVFLSIFNLFKLSVLLQKIWPVFLVLLGLSYVQKKKIAKKKQKTE